MRRPSVSETFNGVETLESRRLLSADLASHIELDHRGTLIVAGTGVADSIVVKQTGNKLKVSLDGTVKTFRVGQVKTLSISGGNGDDTITSNSSIRTGVSGGRGSDDISTGGGNDTLVGGAGDDTLQSGDGNDADQGGVGDDSIVSGAGDDHCAGDDGNDFIDGGAGKNFLSGDDGNDDLVVSRHSHGSHLSGGNGDDLIDTNDDPRSLVDAGAGTDHVHGSHHGPDNGAEFDDNHPDPNENGGGNGGSGGDNSPDA